MAFFDYTLQQKLKTYRFGMYLRKSTEDNEDKQLRSIEGQKEDLISDIVNKFQLPLAMIHVFEEKQSAFKMGRSQFQALIDLIEQGQVDAVMVWHPNRIARNYADGGRFTQLMSDGKLKIVVTPHGVFENSPRDKEYLMNEFTRATRDSDDKSEVVKRGNRTKLKAGYIPSGSLSQGYVHIKNDRDEYIQGVDKDRFQLLHNAVTLILNKTHTPIEALNILNNEWGYRTRKTKRMGGNPLAKSTWYKLLSDPKYYGHIVRAEGEFAANFQPLMKKEEFDTIQVLLGKKANRRLTPKQWAYTGEMTCGKCGGDITMEEKWQIICPICKTKFHKAQDRDECIQCGKKIAEMRNPTILHYTWLHCTKKMLADGEKCKQTSLVVTQFEEQVNALIDQFAIPEGFSKWAIKWLQELHKNEVHERTTIKKNLQSVDTDVQKQLDELLSMRLKGFITDEEYTHKKTNLLEEQKQVRTNVAQTDKRADEWLELCEQTFNFATYAHIWFKKGTTEQKRAILHALGSNLTLTDKILSIHQYEPWIVLSNMKKNYIKVLETIEPGDSIDLVTQKCGSDEAISSLLPDLDSNQDKRIQSPLSYH